jgi:hypothetical protein
MEYTVSQLLLKNPRSQAEAEIYLAEDALALNSKLGRFFVILEINSRERKARQIAGEIIQALQADYYNSPTSDPESSLEEVCKNFNSNLPELVAQPKTWLSKFNIIIGALKEEELVLISFGKVKAMILRGNKFTSIIDIDEDEMEEKPKKETKTLKILSHLSKGEVRAGDVLLFSNTTLFDYFSREKIKKTLQTLKPEQVAEYFHNLLSEDVNPVAFAALFFKIEKEANVEETIEYKRLREFYGTRESMDNLINLERKTSKILTSSFWPNLKAGLAKFKKVRSIPRDVRNLKLDTETRPAPARLAKKIQPQLVIARWTEKTRGWGTNFKDNFKNFFSQLHNFFQNLNRRAKVAALALIILLAIFALSLVFAGEIKKIKIADKNFKEQIIIIENKLTDAEAALIYKNEGRTKEILNEATVLLAGLPQEKNNWQKQAVELAARLAKTEAIVYRLSQVTATTIINFQNIGLNQIKDLIAWENNLVAIGDNNVLYIIDIANKSYYPLAEEKIDYLNGYWQDNNSLIFLTTEKKIVTYNLASQIFNRKNLQLKESVTAWFPYGEKIYTLENNGLITKISEPLTENPRAQKWLLDEPAVASGAQSLLVDGDIWLTKGNKILRFYRGHQIAFEVSELNKPLGQKLEIYTESDWNEIFILDKQNNRLIVAAKSGTAEKQYLQADFGCSEKMRVANDQKTVWLIKKAEVVEVKL